MSAPGRCTPSSRLADTSEPVSLHPLAAIVSEVRRFEIPHMPAGSFASAHHGDPRTTNDIDLAQAERLRAMEGREALEGGGAEPSRGTLTRPPANARGGPHERS